MKLFVGVDPGASGGVVALNDVGRIFMSRRFDGEDPGEVAATFLDSLSCYNATVYTTLERVGPAPGQGVTSMFTFGVGVGLIKGWLRAKGHSFTEAAPKAWQRWISGDLPTAKERTRAICEGIWGLQAFIPEGCRVPHSGLMDAAAIAEFTRQTVMGGGEVIAPKPKKKRRQAIKL